VPSSSCARAGRDNPLPKTTRRHPHQAERAATWGVACHKLEHEFDSGDVLHRIEFPLSPDEDHDSLDLKVQLAMRRLCARIAPRFLACWNDATPQTAGSYHPPWSDAQRRLDFSQSTEQVLRCVRAFGPLECLAHLNGAALHVRRAVGWTEAHQMPAGTVVHASGLQLVVTVADGYVALTEWSLIRADAVTGPLQR